MEKANRNIFYVDLYMQHQQILLINTSPIYFLKNPFSHIMQISFLNRLHLLMLKIIKLFYSFLILYKAKDHLKILE